MNLAKSDVALALALGCTLKTVSSNKANPWHPRKGDGGYDVDACRTVYISHGVLTEKALMAGDDGNEKSVLTRKLKAEAKKEEARARILTNRANLDEGKLLSLEVVMDAETELVSEAVARIMAVASTIGPLCGPGAEDRIRDALADALQELQKLPWVKDEERKKLAALRKSALKTSQASFARPLDLAPSTGLLTTSALTAANPSPDITG